MAIKLKKKHVSHTKKKSGVKFNMKYEINNII